MFPAMLRLGLAGLLALSVLTAALAQERDPEDYRRFFKKPETALEFWKALRFELDVGRPDLAAKHLRGLLALKPDEKALLSIVDAAGTIEVLRLRTVPQWSKDAKEQAQARKDVEELIGRVTEAAKKRAGDPGRIRELIRQLQASREEKVYAIRELFKAGAPAVPHLIAALLAPTTPEERLNLLDALGQMGPNAIAPMLAALDSDNAQLKLDILTILRRRHTRDARQIVPFLWYVSAADSEPAAVRARARQVLADFLDLPVSKLTSAKAALVREAERYFNHEVNFGDPRAVVVWRWDGKGVVQGWPPGTPMVTASQAEEFYGLRFARQALALDPSYRPAQVVFLSLAVEKAAERGGLALPLSRTAPQVAELVAKSSPELVLEVLERALKENRTGVALAMIRSLGERAEVRGKRPFQSAEPALTQALYYRGPVSVRVHMAAVEALLKIPGPPVPKTTARIVEILSLMLTPAVAALPGPKILVAVGDTDWRMKVAQVVRETGAQAVPVGTGREAMRQLRASAEIEAVVMDSSLPMPGLAWTLAQMRADVDVARVPILLAAVPQTRASKDLARRYREVKERIDQIHEATASYRALLRAIAEREAIDRKDVEMELARVKLTTEERQAAFRTVEMKYAAQRKEAEEAHPAAVFTLSRVPAMQKELDKLVQGYALEAEEREAQLTQYTSRFANVRVVAASVLMDARGLHTSIMTQVRDAGGALSPAEQLQFAELAIRFLDGLAAGDPPGYDVRPAGGRVLDALRTGRLSPEGQIAAISVASRLPDARAQADLAFVILDKGRVVPVRNAAATAIVQNIQRHGVLLTVAQAQPLTDLAREPKLDATLKDKLASLVGALRPDSRSTGERLRGYTPTPAAPLPPPPKDKEKD
jgi:CheY-like chemotaxis protein